MCVFACGNVYLVLTEVDDFDGVLLDRAAVRILGDGGRKGLGGRNVVSSGANVALSNCIFRVFSG